MSAYILDAVRTPFGRYGGALAKVRPDDLGAHVVKAILERSPDLDPAQIDDVAFGNANGAGEDNRNVGRMAVLLAGLPTSRPRQHRQPPVRLEPRRRDARQPRDRDRRRRRRAGRRRGVDEPRAVGAAQAREGLPGRPVSELHSTTLGWRMVNPEMPGEWTISLGESTEKLAGIHSVGREAQDAFALRSHQLADAAWNARLLRRLGRRRCRDDFARDEGIRADSLAGEAGQAQAGVRQGRHGDRGQRLAAQRRRLRGARRERGGREEGRPRPDRADRRPRHVRRRPRHLRHRPGRGRQPRARARRASAGTRSTPSSSTRPSPRSRWPASASGRSTPSA